jgi:type II secretory pathway component GspD/PulD (secretin)
VGPDSFFRGGSANLNPPSFFQSQLPGNLPFQGIGLSFGFVGSDAEKHGALDLTLQAMQRNGQAEILSRPSIVATQGVKASVSTGQEIPTFAITNANSNPGGTTLVLTPSSAQTKIGLDMTATHIGDSFVTLQVDPTVDGVIGFSTSQAGASAPIISRRKASTTVTMADGDTLVIGGLITKSTVSDKAKIPLLGDIPLLGKLFTRTKDVETKTELTFWITPHILRKRADFKVIVPPGERERLEKACE